LARERERERKSVFDSTLSSWIWKKINTVSHDGKLNPGQHSIRVGYTETLLYVVHVAEVDSMNHSERPEPSKQTTASFNRRREEEQQQTPKSSPPVISFSNPFRRLNSNDEDKSLLSRKRKFLLV
jgi:hypothetical protein